MMKRMLSILGVMFLSCSVLGHSLDQIQAMQDAINTLTDKVSTLISIQSEKDEAIHTLKSELQKSNQEMEARMEHMLDNGLDKANKKFDKLANGLSQKLPNVNVTDYRAYDMSALPMGTILPYLPSPGCPANPDPAGIPAGWAECDGGVIKEGPWQNTNTPNLNDADGGRGLFLRGGSTAVAGTIEEDAIQNHQHEDAGHTHTDSGHTHKDTGHTHEDAGHGHGDQSFAHTFSDGEIGQWGDDLRIIRYVKQIPQGKADIQSSSANISTDKANIQGAKAIIGGPVGNNVKVFDETRPKNIRVVWIMKVQPAGWVPGC